MIPVTSCTVAGAGLLGCLDVHAPNLTFYRYRVYNSSAMPNGFAVVQNSAAQNFLMQSSYIQASTNATNAAQCSGSQQCYFLGCTVVGGSTTVNMTGAGSALYGNIIYGSGVNGVNMASTGGSFINNSIYQAPNDALRITVGPANGASIINNYFECASGGTGIDLVASTNTLHLSGNAYSGCTVNVSTNALEGFSIYDNGALSQSALVAPSSQNFALKPNGKNIAFPGLFENLPNQPASYFDVGAVQGPTDSAFTFGN